MVLKQSPGSVSACAKLTELQGAASAGGHSGTEIWRDELLKVPWGYPILLERRVVAITLENATVKNAAAKKLQIKAY